MYIEEWRRSQIGAMDRQATTKVQERRFEKGTRKASANTCGQWQVRPSIPYMTISINFKNFFLSPFN